jgi:ketosteroid isomerase-like protein
MPSNERLEAFVETVKSGDHVGAIRDFYTEDATMQENLGPIRKGRDALMAGEKSFLDSVRSVATRAPGPVLHDGDEVVIRWIFEVTDKNGGQRTLDELAHQIWRGDRIAAERFYYDPAQMRPPKS